MGLPAPDHARPRGDRGGAGRSGVRPRQAPDHLHRRPRAAGSQRRVRSADSGGSGRAAEPPAPTTSIVTAPWTRNEHGALSGVKSTSYAENVRDSGVRAQSDEPRRRSSSTPQAMCAKEPGPTFSWCSTAQSSHRRSAPGRSPASPASDPGVVRRRGARFHLGGGHGRRGSLHHVVAAGRPGRPPLGRDRPWHIPPNNRSHCHHVRRAVVSRSRSLAGLDAVEERAYATSRFTRCRPPTPPPRPAECVPVLAVAGDLAGVQPPIANGGRFGAKSGDRHHLSIGFVRWRRTRRVYPMRFTG